LSVRYIAFLSSLEINELNNKLENICLSLWNFHGFQIGIWVIFVLCTWKPIQVQVHIVHMATNLSWSSYCAHDNHIEFTPIMGGIKKKVMIQCITSKIQFHYVVSNAFTHLLIGNLDILGQFCIFHNLNQFKLLELIAK
jgi:hypothetical protein